MDAWLLFVIEKDVRTTCELTWRWGNIVCRIDGMNGGPNTTCWWSDRDWEARQRDAVQIVTSATRFTITHTCSLFSSFPELNSLELHAAAAADPYSSHLPHRCLYSAVAFLQASLVLMHTTLSLFTFLWEKKSYSIWRHRFLCVRILYIYHISNFAEGQIIILNHTPHLIQY